MFDDLLKDSQNSLKAIMFTIIVYLQGKDTGQKIKQRKRHIGQREPGMVLKVTLPLYSGHLPSWHKWVPAREAHFGVQCFYWGSLM